jgi:hypothetical protein
MTSLLTHTVTHFTRPSYTHLSKQGERHQSQYTFVNLLETDADIFIDTRFIKKYTTYGRILEESDFEIEAFALEKQC